MTTFDDDTSPEARERFERELASIGHGHPGRTQMVRDSLRRLADGAGGAELQEAAREILAGRIGIRRALTGEIYGRTLSDGLRRFQEHYERLSPEERRKLYAAGREHYQRLGEEER
ncbi:hypothetical protein GCM10010168_59710 [Actinoplanes ianthinogenes]|uniref:Uncharacterized protein n=1 Tax=Actinoplanes ianthinogenes TaxID=122358 RepID=A0ABN6CMK7_9ACTN|nr:hypothetical protein [Actinoplanes ianthinogenes]BCJ46332.1 hypothetical protein Aiant_69890 [Actinoplanes ianthinogenes]GGR33560.1 hypothetical protein GCM10010168_59710 [Actinoplanes ianthinogenes]